MGVLDELVDFVTTADASALPPRDRAVLRRHTTDVVAARLVGAASSEGRSISQFYLDGAPLTGNATLSADQIAGLATLVRLTETDDIHLATGTTASAVAASCALALAASSACTARHLESAIHVSLETMVRLAKAAGGAGIFYQGIWPTRAAASLGAAAAASRVWGLDRATTGHALSLAVLVTSGRTGQYVGQPSGRWFVFASSVAAGLRAAQAARAGFCGDPNILDNGGLTRALGVEVDMKTFTHGLGAASVLGELSLKPYCTSRQALPGAEAMRAAIASGIDPAAITGFTIYVPTAYAGMISQKLDSAVKSSSYISGAGLAAIAAIDADALFDVGRGQAIADPRILALAAKGVVKPDPSLDREYPSRWPARLELITKDGPRTFEVRAPLGDPENPMDDAALAEKVRRVLGQMGLDAELETFSTVTHAPFETDAAAEALARYFVRGRHARV